MYTRKLQAIGDRSFVISLPKEWVVRSRIKPKTPLYIDETPQGDLLIKKLDSSANVSREISMNADEEKSIQERLVFCYARNFDKILLTAKKQISYELKKDIKSILEVLEGYKITDETLQSIEIRFLFKEVIVTLPQIMRRMVYLLKLMHDALQKKDHETVHGSAISVDRLYHLSERILFGCLTNSSEQNRNSVQSQEELFYAKDLFRRLEVISGRIVLIMHDHPWPKDLNYMRAHLLLIEKLLLREGDHSAIKQELESLKHTAKDRAIDVRLRRIHDLSIDMVQDALCIRFSREIH